MNKEPEMIQAGYESIVKGLYADFFAQYTGTNDPARRQEIERKFALGITTARQVRDRALALVP